MQSSMISFSNAERAAALVSALPGIQKCAGRTVVVKYGGHAMVDPELKQSVMEDIVLLNRLGVKVVLVHGGGPEINDMMQRLGKKPEFINGLRVTDQETAAIVQMVLAGKVNKSLAGLIGAKGGRAVGLSGLDDRLIEAKCKKPELGFVGEVTKINTRIIDDLLERGYIPVIATIGCGEKGEVYNINGDTAAACLAGSLQAEYLLMLTDIAGILRDPADASTLIPELTVKEAEKLAQEGIISGGMLPKVEYCVRAVREGVKKVIIMDGRVPHAVLMELFTDERAGTMFLEGENGDEY